MMMFLCFLFIIIIIIIIVIVIIVIVIVIILMLLLHQKQKYEKSRASSNYNLSSKLKAAARSNDISALDALLQEGSCNVNAKEVHNSYHLHFFNNISHDEEISTFLCHYILIAIVLNIDITLH